LLQQPWGDSTTDVAHHDGFARFNSKYVSRIHAHIGAPDDDCSYIRQRRTISVIGTYSSGSLVHSTSTTLKVQ
jgi:hypothetical protein